MLTLWVNAVATPVLIFEPYLFETIFIPLSERISATILVVVVLPLVPVTQSTLGDFFVLLR